MRRLRRPLLPCLPHLRHRRSPGAVGPAGHPPAAAEGTRARRLGLPDVSTREARIMNIRQFRSEMPLDENVIVLSRGIIKGHWTAGTAGIHPGTLAQVMGLRE